MADKKLKITLVKSTIGAIPKQVATVKSMGFKKLKITLVKSTIGAVPKQVATVKSMGFKKLNSSVELPDNSATRGQIQQIRHLVKVEEI